MIEHPFHKRICCINRQIYQGSSRRKSGAKVIVVGTDFHFGKNRFPAVYRLRKSCKEECGYHLIVVEKLQLNEKILAVPEFVLLLKKSKWKKPKLFRQKLQCFWGNPSRKCTWTNHTGSNH